MSTSRRTCSGGITIGVTIRPELGRRGAQDFRDAIIDPARPPLPEADGSHRGRLHAQFARDLRQRTARQAQPHLDAFVAFPLGLQGGSLGGNSVTQFRHL